ncbi:fumarylacetoacetate hydrolase family protein [Streptomyces aurantiacus]|uniref:Fumarylacetoacetate hydrolase n=1 Tax=Streptomyces aurantiacus TaxID=47760 RepID=A0A7G1NSV2_9ACTN|nr:fumarylacetoacetate hydrolase family protein [Streptomyces aurantiacus]BCL25541.1 fumarylacetoacetate hydrolase [Streptomyces aurantiacus]
MRIANLAGRLALLTGDGAVDVSDGGLDADPDTVFDQWEALLRWSAGVDPATAVPYKESDLRAPVPEPRQIFAVALNYRPHTAEAGYEEPAEPLVFTKFPSCLTGPYATIDLPPGHVDWELEMVAVIGRDAYRVPEEQGWDPVVALTVGQDLSERIVQLAGRPAQFSLGKSFPGFGPVGPALVSVDEPADRDDLELTCELVPRQATFAPSRRPARPLAAPAEIPSTSSTRASGRHTDSTHRTPLLHGQTLPAAALDGEIVQHDRTSNMIFPVPRLVAHLSAICPLRPGDLIFTGTPAGVGNRRTPQRFIGPGDTLVSRIGELGEMRHTFRSAR